MVQRQRNSDSMNHATMPQLGVWYIIIKNFCKFAKVFAKFCKFYKNLFHFILFYMCEQLVSSHHNPKCLSMCHILLTPVSWQSTQSDRIYEY